jgi:hypothetical protein
MANVTLNLIDGTTAIQFQSNDGLWFVDVYHGPTATPKYRVAGITTQAGALRVAANEESRGATCVVGQSASFDTDITDDGGSDETNQIITTAVPLGGTGPYGYDWSESDAPFEVADTEVSITSDFTGSNPGMYDAVVSVTDINSVLSIASRTYGYLGDGNGFETSQDEPAEPDPPTLSNPTDTTFDYASLARPAGGVLGFLIVQEGTDTNPDETGATVVPIEFGVGDTVGSLTAETEYFCWFRIDGPGGTSRSTSDSITTTAP